MDNKSHAVRGFYLNTFIHLNVFNTKYKSSLTTLFFYFNPQESKLEVILTLDKNICLTLNHTQCKNRSFSAPSWQICVHADARVALVPT